MAASRPGKWFATFFLPGRENYVEGEDFAREGLGCSAAVPSREGLLVFVFFVQFDAEGFEKFQILIADFKFSIGTESGDQGFFIGGVFALLTHADRSEERRGG